MYLQAIHIKEVKVLYVFISRKQYSQSDVGSLVMPLKINPYLTNGFSHHLSIGRVHFHF